MIMISKPEDVATQRMMLISPFLAEGLDPAKVTELKKVTAEKNNISYRSLGRYLDAFNQGGFAGLMPKTPARQDFHGKLPDNWKRIVDEQSF